MNKCRVTRCKSFPAEKSHTLWEPPALSFYLLEAPKEEDEPNSHFQRLLPADLSRLRPPMSATIRRRPGIVAFYGHALTSAEMREKLAVFTPEDEVHDCSDTTRHRRIHRHRRRLFRFMHEAEDEATTREPLTRSKAPSQTLPTLPLACRYSALFTFQEFFPS